MVGLLVLSLFVRLYNLEGHSLIADEVTWMVRAKELIYATRAGNLHFFETAWWTRTDDVEAISLVNTFLSGLMYYFTVEGQSHYSPGIFSQTLAVRIPGAVLGAVFIPLVYVFVKKHLGGKVAMIAAILMVLDPVMIGTARIFNQDSTLMILSALALLIYVYNSNKWTLMASALFTAAAFLTKPQGLLIPLVVILSRARSWKQTGIWLVVVVATIYGIWPYLWKDPLRVVGYLQAQQRISATQNREVIFLGRHVENPPWYYYLVTVPYHIQEPILIGCGLWLVARRKKLQLNALSRVGMLYVLVYLVVISTSSIKLGARYALPIWPFMTLAAAAGLARLKGHTWTALMVLPIAALVKFSPYYYLYFNSLTTPSAYQQRETVGFCDGIKPAIEYLAPKLYHGVTLDILYCYPTAQYFTNYTLVQTPLEKNPKFIIVENQVKPEVERKIVAAGYTMEKEIEFAGLIMTRIYTK